MSAIDDACKAYERLLPEPWSASLSGPERVWMLTYRPDSERRLRHRLPMFRTATEAAGRRWQLIDISTSFESWLSQPRVPGRLPGGPRGAAVRSTRRVRGVPGRGDSRQRLREADDATVSGAAGRGLPLRARPRVPGPERRLPRDPGPTPRVLPRDPGGEQLPTSRRPRRLELPRRPDQLMEPTADAQPRSVRRRPHGPEAPQRRRHHPGPARAPRVSGRSSSTSSSSSSWKGSTARACGDCSARTSRTSTARCSPRAGSLASTGPVRATSSACSATCGRTRRSTASPRVASSTCPTRCATCSRSSTASSSATGRSPSRRPAS